MQGGFGVLDRVLVCVHMSLQANSLTECNPLPFRTAMLKYYTLKKT
jgi:hypothetical protein